VSRRPQDKDAEEASAPRADETRLELMKQLITLASGVLVLSATFIARLPDIRLLLLIPLAVSWLALLVSVFFGLQAIASIVEGRLNPGDEDESFEQVTQRARVAKYGFLIGIAMFAAFAFGSLIYPEKRESAAGGTQVIITNNNQK
jgi:hypothetical protein